MLNIGAGEGGSARMRGERKNSLVKRNSTEILFRLPKPPATTPGSPSPSPSPATSREPFYSSSTRSFRGRWCRPHRKQRCIRRGTECKWCVPGRSRRKSTVGSSRGSRLAAGPKCERIRCWLRRSGCPKGEGSRPIKRGTGWRRSCRGLTKESRGSRWSTE